MIRQSQIATQLKRGIEVITGTKTFAKELMFTKLLRQLK